jgi:hypothetical protein
MAPRVVPAERTSSGRWPYSDASTLGELRQEFRSELLSRSRSSYDEYRTGETASEAASAGRQGDVDERGPERVKSIDL